MGTLGGGSFSAREVAFLQGLPAVERVSQKRIEYTDDFKHYVMRHYMAGESPVAIFRACGLDSSLIGYKRIERCIARWKQTVDLDKLAHTDPAIIELEAKKFEVPAVQMRALHDPSARFGFGNMRVELPHVHSAPIIDDESDVYDHAAHEEQGAGVDTAFTHSGIACEQCTEFITQQLSRLEQLEFEVKQLKERIEAAEEALAQ